MIVPHCMDLIRTFECHINLEVDNTSHLFQYLFKYIHKGPDRARFSLASSEAVDEMKDYWTARYVSAGEAAWRILGFHITHKQPSVDALPVHLPNSRKHHQYYRRGGQHSTLSLLNRYLLRPIGSFQDDHGNEIDFSTLTYLEYYRQFRLINWNHIPVTTYTYDEQMPSGNEVHV